MSHLEKAAPPYILRRLDPGVEEVGQSHQGISASISQDYEEAAWPV